MKYGSDSVPSIRRKHIYKTGKDKESATMDRKKLCVCVTNMIPVNEGHEDDFEDRFSKRVHLVDQAPGFIRNEVHRPRPVKFSHKTGKWEEDTEAQGYYQVKTWWRSMEDFENWTRSKSFAEAHSNTPPKEMFAGPARIEVHEVFLSTDIAADNDALWTLEKLSKYRGEAGMPIYIALDGNIYDVSQSQGFYGPGGGYHVFAGRDATRGLAKGLLEEKDVLTNPGDKSDFSAMEHMKLDDWVDRYNSKYPIVGKLGGAPNTSKL